MITYVKGNLLNDEAQALVNTVNIVGVMGKGIAAQFKKRYPVMYHFYQRECAKGKMEIGKMHSYYDLKTEKLIINFPTKMHWANPSEYKWIEAGLKSLADLIVKADIKSIAIPALGCGNGNLMWVNVKRMIEEQLGESPIDIRVYEPE